MSRLVSDSESQAQPCILVDGAAPVLTAHAADRGETFQDEKGKKKRSKVNCWYHQVIEHHIFH